ncbi:MAG: DMT family transporter [Bacteroidales bacterium]|nr:DMT family transporter [Bacteroidales bacterium]
MKAMFMLWLTAAIWGFAFVAQRSGMDYMGPYTFNGIRFAIGSLSLLPIIIYQSRGSQPISNSKSLIWKGSLAGLVLFFGASLQQAGIQWTTAGKAGFITGFYIILVPAIGYLLKHPLSKYTWIGSFTALAGLFLLTINDGFSVGKGDLLVLISAFFWAAHVHLINIFVKTESALKLASLQFAVCALLSIIIAIAIEPIQLGNIADGAIPLLYGGFMSVGIAYTLQVIAQKNVAPATASIILSFETVFAVLGGFLLLNETLGWKAMFGCLLMLFGMWLVQKNSTV